MASKRKHTKKKPALTAVTAPEPVIGLVTDITTRLKAIAFEWDAIEAIAKAQLARLAGK